MKPRKKKYFFKVRYHSKSTLRSRTFLQEFTILRKYSSSALADFMVYVHWKNKVCGRALTSDTNRPWAGNGKRTFQL